MATCRVCKKSYMPEENNLNNEDAKPHLCNICGNTFSLKVQLKKHIMTHAGGAPFTCINCAKNESNRDSKSYNLRVSNKNFHICNICHKSFRTKRLLLQHSHEHDIEEFVCTKCDENFDNLIELEQHAQCHKTKHSHEKKRKHSLDEKNNSKTIAQNSRSKHSFKHKNFTCDTCGKSFLHELSLKKHFEKCISKPNNERAGSSLKNNSCKRHTCKICGKTFARKSSLEGHLLIHQSNDSDSANGQTDTDDEYLSDKEDDEDKEKKSFSCEECEETFSTRYMLKKHSLSHSQDENSINEKDKSDVFPCSQCDEVFEKKKDLTKHSNLIHLDKLLKKGKPKDIRSYSCDICNVAYSRKILLEKHRAHHLLFDNKSQKDNSNSTTSVKKKKKEFICKTCGKKFAGETCYIKHCKKHKLDSNAPALDNNKHKVDSNPLALDNNEALSNNEQASTQNATENIDKTIEKKIESPIKKKKLLDVFHCEYCDEVFTGKRLYAKHIEKHTPEVCGICDKRFVDRESLREHCRIHVDTEEGKMFMQCSQKVLNAKINTVQQDPKVEYIYLVIR